MEKKVNETGASPKITSTYAQFKDEKEKKAAILAKYGFKQRDFDGVDDMSSSSSSSESSDDDDYQLDENNIPKHIARRYWELLKTTIIMISMFCIFDCTLYC